MVIKKSFTCNEGKIWNQAKCIWVISVQIHNAQPMQRPGYDGSNESSLYKIPTFTWSEPTTTQTKIPVIRVVPCCIAFCTRTSLTWKKQIRSIESGTRDKCRKL